MKLREWTVLKALSEVNEATTPDLVEKTGLDRRVVSQILRYNEFGWCAKVREVRGKSDRGNITNRIVWRFIGDKKRIQNYRSVMYLKRS